MLGAVEPAVRGSVTPGAVLRTPTGRGLFTVARYTDDGLVLLLGQQEAWTPLRWVALEEVPDLLRGRGWVPIGSKYDVEGTPGTLDAHLKQYLKRATAGWVAVGARPVLRAAPRALSRRTAEHRGRRCGELLWPGWRPLLPTPASYLRWASRFCPETRVAWWPGSETGDGD